MTHNEVAATLHELAQEARTLQHHLRRFLQCHVAEGPATRRTLESAVSELERLAENTEALAALAQAGQGRRAGSSPAETGRRRPFPVTRTRRGHIPR